MSAASVTLDKERVNVFVFGPGEGEALALWLPRHGWFFVDACRRRLGNLGAIVPQLWLRKTLAEGEPVWGALLTHPHEDHAEGFPDLVSTLEPHRIFVTGTTDPKTDLVRAVEHAVSAVPSANDTKRKNLAKAVHAAALAIREWEQTPGRAVTAVHAGMCLLEEGNVRIDCIAPEAAGVKTMLEEAEPHVLASQANHLSVVLVVTFGTRRILLTGDLPWLVTGTPIPGEGQAATRGIVGTGWQNVVAQHDLTHCCMKIPHHASREALHPGLLSAPTPPRVWALTPKNGSLLPKFWGDANGLDPLLAAEERVLLTTVPSSWKIDGAPSSDRVVTRATLRRRTEAAPTGDAFVDAGDDTRPAKVDAREAMWAFSIDAEDGVVRRAHGSAAIEVVR